MLSHENQYREKCYLHNDIWLGPGRGSVTGALSAYAMGITEMDSLKYDLKFWRFMSKDKYSLAD